ncbi:plasmid maintenance protein CcdB [Enterobacteriaceae bacterium 4M9]|nr:plasmid maintenance protein CcdB [Enterobacteriaceae bacterium 4M9]
MVRQFDVYRNTSAKSRQLWPYYLILQNDFYDELVTRLIVPLARRKDMPLGDSRIAPLVHIEDLECYLFMPNMTYLDVRKLQRTDFVCNVSDARSKIVAALDAIFLNM